MVANRKEVYFEMFLEVSIVTSTQSRSPDSETPVALVKGDEGVAVVYLAGGSSQVCDS